MDSLNWSKTFPKYAAAAIATPPSTEYLAAQNVHVKTSLVLELADGGGKLAHCGYLPPCVPWCRDGLRRDLPSQLLATNESSQALGSGLMV